MAEPKIIVDDWKANQGINNNDPDMLKRMKRMGAYKDLSTIIIIPSTGLVPMKVVQNWWNICQGMNQKLIKISAIGFEVGCAYQNMISYIISNVELSKFRYIFSLEHDNIVPSDVLLRLYESIEGEIDGTKYDAVGSLYWTKSSQGNPGNSMPMIYGDMTNPLNFRPQMPIPDSVQQCRGLGMGATMFRTEMFKDPRLNGKYFQTINGDDGKLMTQDLEFFEKAGGLGYKFASDNRVKTGHYSYEEDIVY